ncbi:MAG: helix-turn-helix domain-containing protein [Nocardioides sp.]
MVASARRARNALSERLRSVRRDAGLTGIAMAERLGPGWGQPKISKIESGRQLPSADDVMTWAAVTGADPAELIGFLERARHEFHAFREAYPTDGGPGAHQAAYAAAEQASSTLFYYQPLIVHGLLQTPEYARAILSLPGGPADHGASADEIDLMIAQRMRRSAILYESGRDITVLIGEAALRNHVGSSRIMSRQVGHVTHLASILTHARIGIVPLSRCPIVPLHGWEQRDNLITIETTAGDLDIADPAEVEQYSRWGQHLIAAAAFGPTIAEVFPAR